MPQVGLGDIPYLGGDGINDGPGTTDGSFINIAGEAPRTASAPSPASPTIPAKAEFEPKYKAEYNDRARRYCASGYACAQVVIKAIKTRRRQGRRRRACEAVRAAGTDTATTFDTILGNLQFDANGDTSQKIISIYKVDLTAADGKGDWMFDSQVDYGAVVAQART